MEVTSLSFLQSLDISVPAPKAHKEGSQTCWHLEQSKNNLLRSEVRQSVFSRRVFNAHNIDA
jgi:hypothetical protein